MMAWSMPRARAQSNPGHDLQGRRHLAFPVLPEESCRSLTNGLGCEGGSTCSLAAVCLVPQRRYETGERVQLSLSARL